MYKIVNIISTGCLPLIILLILGYGYFKKVNIYQLFIEGAEDGVQTILSIFPNLLAMMVAINIFRHSGAIDIISEFFCSFLSTCNIPRDIFPLLLLRPLSGSASLSYVNTIFTEYGPDSLPGMMASTIQGSTETTLYIVAVYFGAIRIKKYRYAIVVGLIADVAGFFAAIYICYHLF